MSTRQVIREFRAMTHKVSRSTTIALWSCLACSIALVVASFVVPPLGAIDPSVFKAAGFLFAFAALFELREAIREGLGVKLTHGETTLEIKDTDGPGETPDPEPEPEDDTEPISDTE